jgi:hypothetical protein
MKLFVILLILLPLKFWSQEIEGNMPVFKNGKVDRIDYLSRWSGNGHIKKIKAKVVQDTLELFYLSAYSKSGVITQNSESSNKKIIEFKSVVDVIHTLDTIVFDFGSDKRHFNRYTIVKKHGDTLIREYYFFNDLFEKYIFVNDKVLFHYYWYSGRSSGFLQAYKYEYNDLGLTKVYELNKEEEFTNDHLIHKFSYLDSLMVRSDYQFLNGKFDSIGIEEYEYNELRKKYFIKSSWNIKGRRYVNVFTIRSDSAIIYNHLDKIIGYKIYKYDNKNRVIKYSDILYGLKDITTYKYDRKGNVKELKKFDHDRLYYSEEIKYWYWD